MPATIKDIVFREFQREREARNSLLEKLRAEKEKVEKTVIEKHRLLSMVCHDSASALSLVMINTSLAHKLLALKPQSRLLDGDDPKNVPSIDDIIEKANYGAMKINEILCSVRLIQGIEEGTASFKPVRVSLCAVFNDVKLLKVIKAFIIRQRIRQEAISIYRCFGVAYGQIISGR